MPLNFDHDDIESSVAERIEVAVDEKNHPYLREIWKYRILPAVRAAAMSESISANDYRDRILVVLDVVVRMNDAMHVYGKYDQQRPEYFKFWTHQQMDLIRAGDESRGFAIARGELIDAATRYVSHPEVQNAPVDWYLIDSLVFAELDSFADSVMTGPVTGSMNWAGVFAHHSQLKYLMYSVLFSILGFVLRYLIPPAAAAYLGTMGHEYIAIAIAAIWALYVFFRLVSLPARWKTRKKAHELLQLMIDAYAHLGNSVISPMRLRDALNKAAAAGVVFDGAVFAIIDRVVERDKNAFVPFNAL